MVNLGIPSAKSLTAYPTQLPERRFSHMYPESSRNFESNKMLGGVGAILTAIGSFVPFTGSIGIVAIVGIILMLISIKGLSEDF
jgi:hypothetical protein